MGTILRSMLFFTFYQTHENVIQTTINPQLRNRNDRKLLCDTTNLALKRIFLFVTETNVEARQPCTPQLLRFWRSVLFDLKTHCGPQRMAHNQVATFVPLRTNISTLIVFHISPLIVTFRCVAGIILWLLPKARCL